MAKIDQSEYARGASNEPLDEFTEARSITWYKETKTAFLSKISAPQF
jgi:hypothetical protein